MLEPAEGRRRSEEYPRNNEQVGQSFIKVLSTLGKTLVSCLHPTTAAAKPWPTSSWCTSGLLGGNNATRFRCPRAGRLPWNGAKTLSIRILFHGPTFPPLTDPVLTLKPFTLRRSTPQPQSCSPTVAMASPKLTTADGQNTGSGLSGQYDASDSPEIAEDQSPVNDLPDDQGPKPQPLQKRRRVTRACDECRRKKIKCDGKQPCTHCTVYSYGKLHESCFVIVTSSTGTDFKCRMVNPHNCSLAPSNTDSPIARTINRPIVGEMQPHSTLKLLRAN